MRTHVTFRYSAEFVGVSEDGGGVLAVSGAHWFAALLRHVPALQVDEHFCQEDWGVAFFARRNQNKFWVGLSARDSEGAWVAHFHCGSYAWFQWLSSSSKDGLRRLLADVHDVLANEPEISNIAWHEESEMSKPVPRCSRTPVDD